MSLDSFAEGIEGIVIMFLGKIFCMYILQWDISNGEFLFLWIHLINLRKDCSINLRKDCRYTSMGC